MIPPAMNGTRTPSVLPALFLLLAGAFPAAAQDLDRSELGGAAQTELRGFLPVQIACETCTEDSAPSVGALWRLEDGSQLRRTLRTLSWAEGVFELSGPEGGAQELRGEYLRDGRRGWLVQLPLEGRGAPFRVQAVLAGYTAPRLAFWPERDADESVNLQLSPVAELFDEHPEWSTDHTVECDVLVPRELGEAVTFFADGRPVAWLYGAGGEVWRFQFVRPGGSLLDRVTVELQPSDEGSHLGFRLPLSGLLGHAAGNGLTIGEHDGLDSDEGLAVTVGEAGVVDLADCPRIPVELEELEPEMLER